MPKGKPWAVHRLSTKELLSQARRARAAGADIVLAAVHIGTEYSTAENAQQVALARALTASPDVDLVYMHHPHVVQPWTIVNKKWVLYGVGNTVAQQEANRTYEGATGRFTFTRVGNGRFTVSKAEYIPTLVTFYRPGRPARLYHVSAKLKTAKGSFRGQAARRPTAYHRNRDAQAPARIKAGIAVALFAIQCSCIARAVVLRRRERTRFSSASDDEVDSLQARCRSRDNTVLG